MLLLQYDPATTELVFKEQTVPPATANLSQFNITSTLSLNAGTITVDNALNIEESGVMQIFGSSVLEVL